MIFTDKLNVYNHADSGIQKEKQCHVHVHIVLIIVYTCSIIFFPKK